MQKSNKRKYLIGALAVLLVAVVVGGTVAWLTAANKVTNTFTVGQVTPPTDGDDDDIPDNPPAEPDEDAGETPTLEGNIYEITDDLKVIPGSDSTKKPWIGIGPESEDSYVFAYIDNNMMSKTADAEESSYFVLNAGWVPVSGQAKPYNGVTNAYTEGLFAWCGVTDGATTGTTPVAIEASETQNVWTANPVFDKVLYPNNPTDTSVTSASDYNAGDNCTMDVWCYIYADVNDTTPNAAIDEAIKWAKSPAVIQGTATPAQP